MDHRGVRLESASRVERPRFRQTRLRRCEPGPALLRHDEQFAIGIVKAAIGHRAIGGVNMNAEADLSCDVAIAAERHDAFDEISRLVRNRNGTPAQLGRCGVGVVERRAADHAIVDARIGTMHDRGLNAIGPGPPIVMAGGGERSSRNQFGIKPVRRTLRRIAPHRQGPRNHLTGEVIAEAGLIVQFARPRARGASKSCLLLDVVHSGSDEVSLLKSVI
jgi:hypothetical protein